MWVTLFSLASPFLDVLESLLEDEEGKENDEIGGDGEESDSNHGDDNDDDDDANGCDSDELYHCCVSNTDLPLSESEESEEENEEENKEENGAAVSEMEEDDSDNAMFVDEF